MPKLRVFEVDEEDPPAEIEKELIEHALYEVLDSPIFRSSKQCHLFLSYIVKHSLAHQDDLLRERVIGASVFGRPPNSDTGNDPIVRSRAAEVRKRLAQYYLDHQDDSTIQISIPTGSYRAFFSRNHRSHPADGLEGSHETTDAMERQTSAGIPEHVELTIAKEEVEIKPFGRRLSNRSWVLLTALLVIVAISFGGLALLKWQDQRRNHLFEQFWTPFTRGSKTTLIYIGSSPSLHFSPSYVEQYRVQHPDRNPGPGTFVDIPSSGSIPTKDLVPFNASIGFGDVAAAARVASTLVSFGQKYDLRYGSDISISDMRSSPVVLIGGYSNSWTLQVTHDLRYTLEFGDRIVDHKDNSKEWQRKANSTSLAQNDYAILSRLTNSKTGGTVLVIAGIGGSGNQAAADFVSDPLQLDRLLENAPSGWETMNMQVVLHTETINGVPKGADVQAVYFW
jgi:hypothetical protein